ncbi:putative L-PSP endoribonuclease family protein [Xylariaceae sp. AK1471]|nr:putative L-PSP endoribonuclease family protein [Xylariaceae sp. AK1471]
MSQLKSYAYPGLGEWAQKNFAYSQAIRVGNRIVCAGQGGWDTSPEHVDAPAPIKEDIKEEIDQAFANVDLNLKHAGGKGWEQVYKVVTYSTDIRAHNPMVIENLRKWMPNHTAVWTAIGNVQLGVEGMHFEIEVEALDEEGAEEVSKTKARAA